MYNKIVLTLCFIFLCPLADADELSETELQSAFKPSFASSEGEHTAGTAFVVIYRSDFYAVTAHHLFSEAGGFSREYSWKELPELVSKVTIQSLSNESINYSTGKAIPIKGAKSVSNWTGKNDIAIFKLDQKPRHYLKIAEASPEVGDPVWLYGLVYNRPETLLLHEAVVVESDNNWLSYEFKDSGLVLNGTSGAAILDSNGNVVSINLSGGEDEGKLYGYGNPLVSIKDKFNTYVPKWP